MRTLIVPFLAILLSACSAYQNAGRKFLEKSSYEYAGLKVHEKLVGCAAPADGEAWEKGTADRHVALFTRDTSAGFELRVQPVKDQGNFACDYVFGSAEDRAALTDVAIDATLATPRVPANSR